MTTESAGGSGADDQTLAAIYEVAKTMDGEGGPTPSDTNAVVAASGQANRGAEKLLVEAGVTSKSGSLQRAALGCLACPFGPSTGQEGVSLPQVARCTDRAAAPVRRFMQRLMDFGIISSAVDPTRSSVSARDRYVLGPGADSIGLETKLEQPAQCGLEGERDTSNMAAEQALVEAGVIDNRSTTRRAALGCLACKIHSGEEGIHAMGVEQCRDIGHDTVTKAFGQLVEGGALEAYTEDYTGGRGRPKVIYTPTYSELGARLRELLEAPAQCGLRRQQGEK